MTRIGKLVYSFGFPGDSEYEPDHACLWSEDLNEPVAWMNRDTYVSENEMDATGQRLVACFNACKGINQDAVPDLLAACREVHDLDLCEGYTLADSQLPQLWKVLSAARAALAKATGRE